MDDKARVLKAGFVILLVGLLLAGGLFPVFNYRVAADDLPLGEGTPLPTAPDEYVPDEIIVKFKEGVRSAAMAQLDEAMGTEVAYVSRYSGFRVLKIPKGKSVAEMVKDFSELPDVEYAEPNYIHQITWSPNDPVYPWQWHFDQINLEAAWDLDTSSPNYGGDSSIVVAVIDSGVAYETYGGYVKAPDLASTNFVNGWDFVNDDAHPNDDNCHGTHVCGTIAQSTNNSLGVAGIAFNTTIMPLKAFNSAGSGDTAWIADAYHYAADNGADIINYSAGGPNSTTLQNATAYARNAGVIIIAAMGNTGDATIRYPAGYNDYAIAVGATRYDETRSYYSSYGSHCDIAAPGGDVTVDQNSDGYVDGVLQNTFNPNTGNVTDFGYWFLQGTSMATPHVSGVAALILAQHPGWNAAQVRHALQSTANDRGSAGKDNEYGWGLLDAPDAVNATLPAPASFRDAGYTTPSDNFTGTGSQDTAYMYCTGLLPSQNYSMVYYDGGDTKRDTKNVSSDASGELSSSHTFVQGTDANGTWHVVICNQAHTPPSTYSANWTYAIAEDNFTLQFDLPPTMEDIVEAEGQYYKTAPVLSNFGFDDNEALDDGWYQMDSYSGNWTVLFNNSGNTSWDSDNWTVPGFGGLGDGSHTIYFMASDNASNVAGDSGEWGWQFYKDTGKPDDPTNVSSTSHSLSTWSSDNTIDVSWTDATDNLSGLDGYSILWNSDNATVPDTSKDIEDGVQSATSPELADGSDYYFHIRSVDNVGNWQSTVHLGPFWIETVPPTDPTNVHSTSHSLSTWSANNTITVNWTDATDNISGLDGYSVLWDSSANTTPSANKTIEEGVQTATSPALADSNNCYFHIRSVDNAGNWQSTVHLGPFWIDATPPTMEAIAEAEGQYYNTAPSFSNFGFDEGSVALDDGWYQMDSYSGNWTALFADVIGTDILDIAVASDNTTIYATNGTSSLYRSTDGGVTWRTVSVIADNTTMDTDLVAVAPDDENFVVVADATSPNVYVSDNISESWDSLSPVIGETLIPVTGLDSINDIALSVASGGNHFVAVAGEDGGVAEVWYYEILGLGAVWTEASADTGFDAGNAARALAFSPDFASDDVMVAITEEDDGGAATDNVSFQVYSFNQGNWNSGAFSNFPATIASDDGIAGLDSASISMAPDYRGSDDLMRHVFVGLTVAGDVDAVATSGIYRLNNDNVTALKIGEQIHSVAYDGTNLVAGSFNSTDVWRNANPMAPTPTVNVTDSSNRPGGENRVVVGWAGSKAAAGTSGNVSAFAVSTDNGTSFSDILVITDTSWDNDGWTIPGFAALSNASHTIYFKASDNLGNIEGESGEWDWQFYKGSPPPSGGGGGGGGGGGAGITPVRPYLKDYTFTEGVSARSEDFKVKIYIPEGTVAKNAVGSSISSIRIQEMAGPPLRPKDTVTVSLVYEMGPAGATFEPPVLLTIEYDESKIPEGVAEKTLVVSNYDDSLGRWVDLESTVATENNTATAKVSHFSAFAVLAYTRPASFTITELSIMPEEIELGEPINISVLVTNDGNFTGSYEVSLKMDDLLVQTKVVTLAGSEAETVSFSITPESAGEHVIDVSGAKGRCLVNLPKAPAVFSASDLIISPVELLTGGRVTFSIVLINTGGLSGTHGVILKIDGAHIETKWLTLDAGESQKVVFTKAQDRAGTYSVDIEGLSGSFVVTEIAPATAKEETAAMPAPALEPGPASEPVPTQPSNLWMIVGIVAGIALAGLVSYYFIKKKRKTV